MAEYTKKMKLIKPGGQDYINVEDMNANMDNLDSHTHTAEDVGAYTKNEVDTKLVEKSDTSHKHTAAQVGATPSSHASDKDNPHDVTSEQIGARKVHFDSLYNKDVDNLFEFGDFIAGKTTLSGGDPTSSTNSSIHLPNVAGYFILRNEPYHKDISPTGRKGRIQTAINSNCRTFIRIHDGSSWNDWNELANLNNIEGKYLPLDCSVPLTGNRLQFHDDAASTNQMGSIFAPLTGEISLDSTSVDATGDNMVIGARLIVSSPNGGGVNDNSLVLRNEQGKKSYKIFGEHNAAPAKTNLTLASGISNEAGTTSHFVYKLLTEITLNFSIVKTSGSGAATIATLPTGKRPKSKVIAPCTVKTSSGAYEPAICEITTTGVISVTAGSNAWTNAYAQVVFLTT